MASAAAHDGAIRASNVSRAEQTPLLREENAMPDEKQPISPGDQFRATANLPTAERGPGQPHEIRNGLMPGEQHPAPTGGRIPGEEALMTVGRMPGEEAPKLSPGDLFRATAHLPTAEKAPAQKAEIESGLMPGEQRPAPTGGRMPGEEAPTTTAGKMPGEEGEEVRSWVI